MWRTVRYREVILLSAFICCYSRELCVRSFPVLLCVYVCLDVYVCVCVWNALVCVLIAIYSILCYTTQHYTRWTRTISRLTLQFSLVCTPHTQHLHCSRVLAYNCEHSTLGAGRTHSTHTGHTDTEHTQTQNCNRAANNFATHNSRWIIRIRCAHTAGLRQTIPRTITIHGIINFHAALRDTRTQAMRSTHEPPQQWGWTVVGWRGRRIHVKRWWNDD